MQNNFLFLSLVIYEQLLLLINIIFNQGIYHLYIKQISFILEIIFYNLIFLNLFYSYLNNKIYSYEELILEVILRAYVIFNLPKKYFKYHN